MQKGGGEDGGGHVLDDHEVLLAVWLELVVGVWYRVIHVLSDRGVAFEELVGWLLISFFLIPHLHSTSTYSHFTDLSS